MLQDLFGKGHVTASLDLPSHIGRLVERLPITFQITAKQLIQKHTMYPLYSAFLPPDQADAIYQSMIKGNGNDIYMRSGIMASSIRSNLNIRYCRTCFINDVNTYGEAYWHRMHQVPGLDVCMKHGIFLQDSKVQVHQENKHVFVPPDEENCSLDYIVRRTPLNDIDKYCSYNKSIETLLVAEFPNRPFGWFEQYYLNRLQNLGYASVNGGKVDQERLQQDVLSFFGADFLGRLQSSINGEDHWLNQISRRHRKSFHPIRHLIFLQFLNSDLEDIFYQKESHKPFGDGPWMCMNPAAEHYETEIINEVTLTACDKTKEPLGTFTCSCGFIYTRRADDDPLKISRVKQFGKVWEEECIRLAKAGMGLREIGRRLHADPNTVKKCLLESEEGTEEKVKMEGNKQIAVDRTDWEHLQRSYPSLSKTEIRKMNPALYARLYRADRMWLEKESPKPKVRTKTTTRGNWLERDREIIEIAKEAVTDIQNLQGKPKQVSKSAIGHAIGRKAILEQHLDKLPLTKAYLEQVIESDEKYRLRRINWAIEQLESKGKVIMKWEILRKAGIRPEFVDASIEEMISTAIG